jgi:hypothetical protein
VHLGDLLVSDGTITHAARNSALAHMAARGGRLGSALVEGGATPDRVALALARQHGVLAVLESQLAGVPATIRDLVPEEVARRLCALPIRVAPGTGELIVALRDPGDAAARAELERVACRPVRPAAVTEIRLREALDAIYRSGPPVREIPRPVPPIPLTPQRIEKLAELRGGPGHGVDVTSLRRRIVIAMVVLVFLIGGLVAYRHQQAKEEARRYLLEEIERVEAELGR